MSKDKICIFDSCNKAVHSRGLCSGHYSQLLRSGAFLADPLLGAEGRFQAAQGNRQDRWVIHTQLNSREYKDYARSRVVALFILKRPLQNGEVVHHINKDTCNDMPSNLAVVPNRDIHNLLDAFSTVQLHGLVQLKDYKNLSSFDNVYWLTDYLEDYPSLYVDAAAWWRKVAFRWEVLKDYRP